MHICASRLITIGSDNGLSPGRRQAIIWTNDGVLLIRTLGTNFNKILSEIHTFSFKTMHLNMSYAKQWQFCIRLNVISALQLKGTLRWRHNDHDSVSNHQPHGCLLNRLFRRRSKKTFRVTGLCVGNSPGPVNSPHKVPVTRKMFPFDDVIMIWYGWVFAYQNLMRMYTCVSMVLFLTLLVKMFSGSTTTTSHERHGGSSTVCLFILLP